MDSIVARQAPSGKPRKKNQPDKDIYKRKHLVDYFVAEIESGRVVVGSMLPSISELRGQFGLSRTTIIAAYRELKAMGVIKSIPRKGYRVVNAKNIVKHRIFLFLDELNGYKKVLYESFKAGIGRQGTVDVYFHHFNATVFENIIAQNLDNYTSFVVRPTHRRNCAAVLKTIPEGKLFILDGGLVPFGKKYPSVCQNFGRTITESLFSVLDLLVKYNKLVLVHPDLKMEPDLIEAFLDFCKEHRYPNKIFQNASKCKPVKGECYVVVLDDDLVSVIGAAYDAGLEIGKDIGIISYNDTPLKRYLANGITVISTDFRKMGQSMADLVLNRKKDQMENPCYMIRRGSL